MIGSLHANVMKDFQGSTKGAGTVIRLSLPKEHGAYVVLASSCIYGLIRSPSIDLGRAIPTLVLIFALFLIQKPAYELVRNLPSLQHPPVLFFWLVGLLAASILFSYLLSTIAPQLWVIIIPGGVVFAAYALMDPRRFGMGERSVVGFLLLTLAAPTLQLAVGTPSISSVVETWFIASLYFCGSAMNIRLRLVKRATAQGMNAKAQQAILYHALLTALCFALASTGLTGWTTVLVLSVSSLRLIWILQNLERFRALPLKRIGVQESLLAVLFLGLTFLR